MNRREFLATSTLGLAGVCTPPALSWAKALQEKPTRKAMILGMVKGGASFEEKFAIIKAAGFDGVEVPPMDAAGQEKLKSASEKTGLPIHSVIFGGWGKPLSSPDPKLRDEAVELLKAGLRGARAVGADNLLLVPALVDGKTRYVEAYERSQEGIRKALSTAEEEKVVISVEEVWNNFLLSPLEFVRYVDEFQSPWLKAYFDIGNIVKNGWPEDWIRTLGKRINRVHLKDYKKKTNQFVKLTEGDVNWKEVRKAFTEVGWPKFMTAEFNGDDYLEPEELAKRIDRIIAGD
ncbi:MAG TPA: sugar phosphate isomerase/epimerase family protein [Planctomycetota bacterium]|nr:sugar phosphate isomerase/epimerase family protein [Planctomycetota bacterium]